MTKEQKALKGSIAHWERMIKWAKTQGEGRIFSYKMNDEIEECPSAMDCPLCQLHYKPDRGVNCEKCALHLIGENCGLDNSLWKEISSSKSRDEWLTIANEMLVVLKELLKRSK